MSEQNYTTSITVDQSPEEVFAAVTNVRGWWSEEIIGDTANLGDEFVFEVPDTHYAKFRLTEVVPDKRVVWHTLEARVEFVDDKDEWTDTCVIFEISQADGKTRLDFTHVGLAPAVECYDLCSDAWASYIRGSLRNLITTGKGAPARASDTFESEVEKHQEYVAST